jgi:biotin carboxylase
MGNVKRVLLVASTTGYQIRAFDDAARANSIELVLASDRCHVLDDPWGDRAVAVRFEEPMAALGDVQARGRFDGIVAVGDWPAEVAAQIAETLGLRFSAPGAVSAAGNKLRSRQRFQSAGLPTPEFRLDEAPARYPCVLKPLGLSASRGVIRANNVAEFVEARSRIRKMIGAEGSILVEDFIPGREFALEGIVTGGRLKVFALFDKPDPLDGPFFEETIYVTPSRESCDAQSAIFEVAQRAVAALGLMDGPVHAEFRVNDAGVWMLEVAARPIGGLCARVVRFEGGVTLEQTILRHAIGEDVSDLRLASGAHGVMMIPVERAGIFVRVEGVEDARGVAGIEDVVITAKEGQVMVPWPEGASYPGFIFARAGSAAAVENALREAHSRLNFELTTTLPIVR